MLNRQKVTHTPIQHKVVVIFNHYCKNIYSICKTLKYFPHLRKFYRKKNNKIADVITNSIYFKSSVFGFC
jgi:hypothetical protein